MRVTWVVAAAASVSVLLDVVWPPAANTATGIAWLGGLWVLGETIGPVRRFRAKLVLLAALLAASGVVWGVADLVWSLESGPAWLLHLRSICVAWVSCLTVIGLVELRFRRQRAKAIGSSGPG